jgi:mercuric reductase
MPSKHLITVGTYFYNATNNSFIGIKYNKGKLDFKKVIEQKDKLVEKFRKEKYVNVVKSLKNVTYLEGKGEFISKNEVRVGNKILRGKKFLVAVGARASIIPVKGIEKIDYLTNEEALNLKEVPKSMCVVGGRALGLEFAQMYAHFGTKVTVLQRSERILPESEPEISESLRRYLKDEGITIYTGTKINYVDREGKNKIINFTVNNRIKIIKCQQFLFATGRKPNTDKLGLDKIGVKVDERGFIVINDGMETSASHVWAAGDCTGEPMLETLAAKQGAIDVENAFTDKKRKINLQEIPSAIFTYPEVASVGLTDAETIQQGIKCTCNTFPLEFVPKAHIIGDTRGLVKLVVDRENKKIQGVHILSPHAADLIHEGVLAVKFGLTIDDIIDTVHVFPTLSEAIKLAAQSFYKDVSKLSCCTE